MSALPRTCYTVFPFPPHWTSFAASHGFPDVASGSLPLAFDKWTTYSWGKYVESTRRAGPASLGGCPAPAPWGFVLVFLQHRHPPTLSPPPIREIPPVALPSHIFFQYLYSMTSPVQVPFLPETRVMVYLVRFVTQYFGIFSFPMKRKWMAVTDLTAARCSVALRMNPGQNKRDWM